MFFPEVKDQRLFVEEGGLGFVNFPEVTGAFLIVERLKRFFGAATLDQGGPGAFLRHPFFDERAAFAVADAQEVRAIGGEPAESEWIGGSGERRGVVGFEEARFRLGEPGFLGLPRFDDAREAPAGAVGLVAPQPEHTRE